MSDDNQQQEKPRPETTEKLVSLAVEYFSNEFPDSAHGCPSPSEIAAQIESEQVPDDALRKHLLACSSCFVTYRERLQRFREMQPVAVPMRRRIAELLRNPWLRVLVPSLPVILLAAVAALYLRPNSPQEQVKVGNSPAEVVNTHANAVTTVSPSPAQVEAVNQVDEVNQPDRATHVARIDLRNYSPLRGNETGAEPPPLQIEQEPTAFTITLPEGSPSGSYSVSILDAFGKPVKTRTSSSIDGKRVTAILNLDNLRSRNYRLCVSRSDEPPNCYPIVITNRGK